MNHFKGLCANTLTLQPVHVHGHGAVFNTLSYGQYGKDQLSQMSGSN